jgi:hypothetical protein
MIFVSNTGTGLQPVQGKTCERFLGIARCGTTQGIVRMSFPVPVGALSQCLRRISFKSGTGLQPVQGKTCERFLGWYHNVQSPGICDIGRGLDKGPVLDCIDNIANPGRLHVVVPPKESFACLSLYRLEPCPSV